MNRAGWQRLVSFARRRPPLAANEEEHITAHPPCTSPKLTITFVFSVVEPSSERVTGAQNMGYFSPVWAMPDVAGRCAVRAVSVIVSTAPSPLA